MLNWVLCSDRMPDNPNSLKNMCLIRTIHEQYMFANWSIHLKMWRRIEVPFKFNFKKIIDEIIEPEDVIAWVSMDEIKMKK